MSTIDDVRRSTKALSVVVLIILLVVSGIFIYLLFHPPCCPATTGGGDFGDEYLTGTYKVDAFALTNEGTRVGTGIRPLADPPTVVFEDDFEGSNPWDSNNGVDVDYTDVVHWDNESAYFDPGTYSVPALDKTFGTPIDVDADETAEMYFYVNISTAWDGGSYGKGETDHLALKIGFDDANVLVYEIFGSYTTPATNEKVIDVSTQVTMKGIWCGINVNNIDDDYLVQFGGITPTLPIPGIASVTFILNTTDVSETVILDDVTMIVSPKPYTGGSFWRDVDSGAKVSSYVVDVNYSVSIDGVKNDTVHVQVSLWVEIYNGSTNPSDIVVTKTLVQKQLFILLPNETTPEGDPAILNVWSSKVFDLPIDGDVFGEDLYHAFYIKMEAWGEIEVSPGDYVYASDDYSGGVVDSLHFEWVFVDASIDIIVYAIGGVFGGAGVIGTIAIAKKKRNKSGSRIIAGKESLFN